MPSPAQPLAVLTHEFFPYRGGIAVYAEETARAAAAAGYAVTVWAPQRNAQPARPWPFALRPIAMRGTQDWACRLALMREIRAARAELEKSLVWLPEPGALLAAMYLNALGQLPAQRLVLTLHGSEILRFAGRPHRRWLFQKLLDRADRVGVVSEFNRALLQKHFRVAADKIAVVPGALRGDFPAAKIEPSPRPPGAPLVLLTVGRVHPRKGQHCVLEALAMAAVDFKRPLEYRIVGPVVKADYQKQLEELARKSGVVVKFLGEVPDAQLPEQYAQADIFVMTPVRHGPSVEGFGLVYLEAGAFGLPIIAHDSGGAAEAVRHGVTGVVVDPDNHLALADALDMLANSPKLRAGLGSAAREHAQKFSWARNVERLFGGGNL